MAQVINTNVASLTAQRNLNKSQNTLNTSLQRLSSGLRINSAKDDAAGLAISERMTSQIRGLDQAQRNANDGISLAQTAEGALGSIGDNLQRMRELAVQSVNATNSASDRAALQQEVNQLAEEIDRVASQTDFNGTKLLNGNFSAQKFQVGANVGQTITIDNIASARTSSLGSYNGFKLTNQSIGTASDTKAAQSITVGGATTDLGTIANDAKSLASAINASGIAGLSATANVNTVSAGTQAVTTTAGGDSTLEINGLSISITATTDAATNRANAVKAINDQSAVTGVVATDDGSGVKLTAADGRNITIDNFAAGGATGTTIADFGLAAENTYGATLDLTYQAPTGVAGDMTFTGAFNPTAQTIAKAGTAISAIDISSVGGAETALSSIDAALSTINTERAKLGAVQNRFSSTVSNLQTTSENLSASRSRIQDTDFAAETSNLTKAQILQQAGTAMLAQAKALPQQVLSLLQ